MDGLKIEVDGWVKEFNERINALEELNQPVEDLIENCDHNYELIFELVDEMRKLREEVAALRLLQILQLKNEIRSRSS